MRNLVAEMLGPGVPNAFDAPEGAGAGGAPVAALLQLDDGARAGNGVFRQEPGGGQLRRAGAGGTSTRSAGLGRRKTSCVGRDSICFSLPYSFDSNEV